MSNREPEGLSPEEKADIALKVISGDKSVEEISRESDLSEEKVQRWTDQLRKSAKTLFGGSDESFSLDIGREKETPPTFKDLRKYVSLLRATLNAAASGILVTNLDGKIVTYNETFRKMWNISKEVMAEKSDEKAVQYVLDQLEDPEDFREGVQYLYENPSEESVDKIEFKDGRVFERYSLPQRVDDEIVGRVWSFVDVTEYRDAKRKAERYRELLESINANVEEGILRSTPGQGLIYVNDAFVSMFGYDSKEEVLNKEPKSLYARPEEREDWLERIKKEKTIKNEEILYRRKDNSTFWALESSTLVEKEDEIFIDGIITDITERKKVEEALRQSEEKYRTILENIEDGYFESNLKGNFVFFNESVQDILGYPAEELQGMNYREYTDEENAERVFQAYNRVFRTGEPEKGCDWEIITKDGEKRFVEASVTLKKNSEGEATGFRSIIRDITNRKQRERQIRESLKEKEALLSEIHHRVKNNLAVISGLLFLQTEKTDDENARELLFQCQNRINSMATIHELLYDTESFSGVDPETYIHELVDFISGNMETGEKEIEVRVSTSDIELNMNNAIPCALIINELMTNAYKYAFEGMEEGTIEINFMKEDGNYRLEIADNGVGIPEDQEMHEETDNGLGLFLVNTMIQQLDGEFEVERDEGTRFIITFPV